jgi:hypothetical protein
MKSLAVQNFGREHAGNEPVFGSRPPVALQLLRQRYQHGERSVSNGDRDSLASFAAGRPGVGGGAEPMLDAIRAASQSLKHLIKINEQLREESAAALAVRDAELETERSRVAMLRADLDGAQSEIERLLADNKTIVEDYEARAAVLKAELERSGRFQKMTENMMEYYYGRLHPELSNALTLAGDVIRKSGYAQDLD